MNKRMAFLLTIGSAAIFLAAGCGDDAPAPDAGTTIEKYFAQATILECQHLFACCDMAEIEQHATNHGISVPKTADECVTSTTTISGYYINEYIRPAIDAGRLIFDSAKAERCIASAEPGNCTKMPSDYPDCNGLWIGAVHTGGACANDMECIDPETMCLVPGLGADFGTCTAKAKEGENCKFPLRCASGLVCETSGMTTTCIKLSANGEACSSKFDCNSNYCDPTGLCAPLRVAGESCAAPEDCSASYCDIVSMKCTAFNAPGAPCSAPDQCEWGACDMETQTCPPAPPRVCDGN